jgi:hypothetical protein
MLLAMANTSEAQLYLDGSESHGKEKMIFE